MHELNRVFTNPNIIKILHGADYDIEWLQKDFGIYVVNMFDTGQAARVLQLPSYGLASLLYSICGVIADKKYQLADWRIRPIPTEMLKYAREDTHYLLYVYDYLNKKLIQKSLVKCESPTHSLLIVYKKSNELCLKNYAKPFIKSGEYYQLLARNVTHMNKRQISVLKLVYKFRDYVARKLDVSNPVVLSNKTMFGIAKLANIDYTTIMQVMDKNSRIRNFIPELLQVIQNKLEKNNKKIDKEGSNYKGLEKSYIENIKQKMISSKVVVSKIEKSFQNKFEAAKFNKK